MQSTQSLFFSDSAIERVLIYSGDVDHNGVSWEGVDKIKAMFKRLKCPWQVLEVMKERPSSNTALFA